jgi:hypothetical protein
MASISQPSLPLATIRRHARCTFHGKTFLSFTRTLSLSVVAIGGAPNAVLQVSAAMCAMLVVVSMLPCLMCIWQQPRRTSLLRATAYAALCGFMFGFHVHEKAALTFVLLLAMDAMSSSRRKGWALALACAQPCVGHLARVDKLASLHVPACPLCLMPNMPSIIEMVDHLLHVRTRLGLWRCTSLP